MDIFFMAPPLYCENKLLSEVVRFIVSKQVSGDSFFISCLGAERKSGSEIK